MSEQKELKVEDIKTEAEEKRCPVQKSLYYVSKFLSDIMCGKCFPCALGTYEAKKRLENIISGKSTEADVFIIKRIANDMLEASRCKKGKDNARFFLEWMKSDALKDHLEGVCHDRECLGLIEYRIVPDKCIMCGECQVVCKPNAIVGEKMKPYFSGYLPFEIRQKRCTKCGDCIKVCPTGAIVVIDTKVKEE